MIDLKENRLIPLIPCPLVQPPLILVPRPTNSPPPIKRNNEFVIDISTDAMFASIIFCKISSFNSVGKGPSPTRVVYALHIPKE